MGDTLAIMDAGAYFVPFATSFSFPQPGVVMIDEGRVVTLRRAETFEDMRLRGGEGPRRSAAAPAAREEDRRVLRVRTPREVSGVAGQGPAPVSDGYGPEGTVVLLLTVMTPANGPFARSASRPAPAAQRAEMTPSR